MSPPRRLCLAIAVGSRAAPLREAKQLQHGRMTGQLPYAASRYSRASKVLNRITRDYRCQGPARREPADIEFRGCYIERNSE